MGLRSLTTYPAGDSSTVKVAGICGCLIRTATTFEGRISGEQWVLLCTMPPILTGMKTPSRARSLSSTNLSRREVESAYLVTRERRSLGRVKIDMVIM